MEHPEVKLHLFGAFCVPDPKKYISPADLPQVDRAISLIREFEKAPRNFRASWDFDHAHKHLVDQELTWWRSRDVERPKEYLARPSGSLSAPVACVLFNPTFSVADPCSKETFDTSNATMAQMERAGLNCENTFFLDQIARRDISDNVKLAYPEDLWQIHERFLREVWDNMQAVVVICWGSAVRNRLLGNSKKSGWFQKYEMLRLWGLFGGIELYLELNADKTSMKRFVLFVKHPSYFFYIQSEKDCAKKFRQKQGKPQDLALEIAAKLGRIQIECHFYESSPRLRVSLAIPQKLTMKREGWKGEAAAQLRCAFPGLELTQKNSHRIRGARRRDQETLDEIVSLMKDLNVGGVCMDRPKKSKPSTGLEDVAAIDKAQRVRRFKMIKSFWDALEEMIVMSDSLMLSGPSFGECLESFLSTTEDVEDVEKWEDLPAEIATLIQDQSGLKLDGRPIASREDLELAYRLLHNFVPKWTDTPETLGFANLASSVLLAYGRMISRERKTQIGEMLILRDTPYDVLPRKCGWCDQMVLDDPFPYWSKDEPDTYVSWANLGGCGNFGCQSRYPNLKPLRSEVKWSAAVAARLDKESRDKAKHRKSQRPMNWLLRSKEEQGDLPDEVQVKCRHCPRTKSVQAKWTIHSQSRLVLPELQCGGFKDRTEHGCGKKGPWDPVGKAKKFRTIHQPQLSRTFSAFLRMSYDLRRYPRNGDVIFAEKDYAFRIAELQQLKCVQPRNRSYF